MTSTRGRRTHALVVAPRDPWRSRHCGHDPRLGCVGWHPEPLAPRPYGRNRCNVQRRPLAMEVSRPGMLQARNLLSGQLVSCCQKSLSTALIPSYFSHIFARVQYLSFTVISRLSESFIPSTCVFESLFITSCTTISVSGSNKALFPLIFKEPNQLVHVGRNEAIV